jgi:chromate transporter
MREVQQPDEQNPSPRTPTVSLPLLIREMLLLGFTGFGGNLQARLNYITVTKHHWLTKEEFNSSLAIAGLTPGGNSSNLAAEIGRRLHGGVGLIVAYISVILPGGMLAIAFDSIYLIHHHNPVLAHIERGIESSAVALMAFAAYEIGRSGCKRFTDVAIASVAFVGIVVLHLPIEFLLLMLGGTSFLLSKQRKGG